jgi:hypothetical protein
MDFVVTEDIFKEISEITGLSGKYILIYDNNKITGIVPFIIKNKIFYTLPHTTHCLPIIPDKLNFYELKNQIRKITPEIKGMIFRFCDGNILGAEPYHCRYYNQVIFLGDNLEEYYNSLERRSIRRLIKKSYNNGLKIRFGKDEKDLKIFYKLETILRRSLGLPPAPYHFFYSLWKNLGEHDLLLLPIIEKDSRPILASMDLKFKDQLYFEYTGQNKKFKYYYPYYFFHWEMIKKAHSEFGSRIVDLGRTDKNQTGLIQFKQSWKAINIDIIEHYENTEPRIINPKSFNFFKNINKVLPLKVLQLEGRILFNKFFS